jgi:hypothetical protein
MLMPRLSGLLLLLAIASAVAAEPAASGKFTFREVEYVAVDAVAWTTGGDYPSVQIAVSNLPFDPAVIAADGVVNDADLMAHAGATLMISYMPEDLHVLGIRLRNETGHGADFRCEGSGLLTITSDSEASIAGRFACEEHQVSFTAPVLATPGE